MACATAASAATIWGETRDRNGSRVGMMHYRSDKGVANRVTVAPHLEDGRVTGIVVEDRAEPVHAKDECVQLDPHSARCPFTESEPAIQIRVNDRDDRVGVTRKCAPEPPPCRHFPVRVIGGPGDDVLTGGGEFFGDGGHDILLGSNAKESWDRFHGGPGRDRMEGRGPARNGLQDQFFDGENHLQAARDVVIGGKGARAVIDYSSRTRSLRIDLHSSRMGPEGDLVSGIKSVTTGMGDDVLIGTGGPNELGGGPGTDRIYGRSGNDVLSGGLGDDVMFGGDGDDALAEPALYGYSNGTGGGRDRFVGGRGTDEIRSVGPSALPFGADRVYCDSRDAPVFSDRSDRLHGCGVVAGWDLGELELRTRPKLTRDGAVFTLRCGPTEAEEVTDPETGSPRLVFRCGGELIVSRTASEEFGRQAFEFGMENYRTDWVKVTVPLTAAGRRAIRRGDVLQVAAEVRSSQGDYPSAGYRAVLGG